MKEAPKEIPEEMIGDYTVGGKIPIVSAYRNDCDQKSQAGYNKNYTKKMLAFFIERIKNGKAQTDKFSVLNGYGMTDIWMYEALEKYPIKGKSVCIVGSTAPWYEAMCLAYGAKSCTVFEYSDRENFADNIKYIKPEEIGDEKYDICISISSIEHDGLGRYGDPLNPNGDLLAMKKAKEYIKKGGLMFLSIPVGPDAVFFNVHRVYGRIRLPMLLEGWKKLDAYGLSKISLTNNVNNERCSDYQPVFILKND
jgi:hypothetical protein